MIEHAYYCPDCKKQWDSIYEDVTRCCYCGGILVKGCAPPEAENDGLTEISKAHEILDGLNAPKVDIQGLKLNLCGRIRRLVGAPLVNETFPHNMGETIKQPISKREEILLEAIKCVTKDRNATHGAPEDNFKTIAKYWNTYVDARVKRHDYNGFFDEVDVAVMMLLMKVSRLAKSPEHMDHWVDIAGYAACGGGIATKANS